MILHTESDEQYASAMAALRVINTLRGGPKTATVRAKYAHTPLDNTPWVQTRWAKEQYL